MDERSVTEPGMAHTPGSVEHRETAGIGPKGSETTRYPTPPRVPLRQLACNFPLKAGPSLIFARVHANPFGDE